MKNIKEPDFDNLITQLALEKQCLTDFEQKAENIIAQIRLSKNRVRLLDKQIREIAVKWYKATGESNPHPAISIKKTKKTRYDEQINFKRAIERQRSDVLKLNMSALKKLDEDWIEAEDYVDHVPHIQMNLGEYT